MLELPEATVGAEHRFCILSSVIYFQPLGSFLGTFAAFIRPSIELMLKAE